MVGTRQPRQAAGTRGAQQTFLCLHRAPASQGIFKGTAGKNNGPAESLALIQPWTTGPCFWGCCSATRRCFPRKPFIQTLHSSCLWPPPLFSNSHPVISPFTLTAPVTYPRRETEALLTPFASCHVIYQITWICTCFFIISGTMKKLSSFFVFCFVSQPMILFSWRPCPIDFPSHISSINFYSLPLSLKFSKFLPS